MSYIVDDQPTDVRLNSTVATFGDLIASSRQDQISINFSQTIPESLVSTTVTGSGSVTNTQAQTTVASGSTASSTAQMQTRRMVNYEPSHEIYAYFTATFSSPTANGSQFIGLFDDDNGFSIGYQGTDFCVRRTDGGVNTDVVLADFNGKLTTEFKRSGVVETLNPQNGNVYRIRFGWLGNAPIEFEILNPDGVWILLHQIKYPNSSDEAHIENPDLPLRSEVDNGGDAVDVSIATSSWAAGVVKTAGGTEVIFQRTDSVDGALPTGSAPTIDPVFNNEANVFDSGWIRTLDFPGGNFVNISGNQTVNVYLMNASDDQGSNIVGNTQPSIQTVAFVPAVLQAPYFDEYYRILVSNESGFSLSSYSFYNRGHSSVQQGLTIGIEQTLLGFFAAELDRSILAAKNDAGAYDNITRADSGGLRVAVNEHEVQVPISPLTAFETNGTSVGTSAVQIATGLSAQTKTISIKADGGNTKQIHIGQNSSVTTANGYPLQAGDAVEIEVNESTAIWAISSAGSQTVYWMGVNTHEDAPV